MIRVRCQGFLPHLLVCVVCFFLQTAISAAQVTVVWNASPEPNLAGYSISFSTNSTDYTKRTVGLTTSTTLSNLVEGETYTIYATAFNSAGLESNPSDPVNYTVPAAVSLPALPVISGQPTNQTVTAGMPLNLAVVASGTGLQYQWYRNGGALAAGTSATLQIASAQTSDAGSYYVTVWNAAGSVTSASATVTVLTRPAITTQPASQTLALSSALNLTVQASGSGPLQYQWYRGSSAIAGATLATFGAASVQTTDAGNYYAKVWNGAGSATSAVATVTVLIPPAIVAQPASQIVVLSNVLNLSVQALGSGPLQYQWYRNGAALSGGTSASLQIAAAKATDAGTYYAVVSNGAGSARSADATVVVLAPPTITTQPVSQTVTIGSALNLSVQASGTGPLQYQWFRDGVAAAGGTGSTLQVASAQLSDAGSYYAVVSNAGGTATSATATVSVNGNTLPVITTQPQSQTIAVGASTSLSVVATGSGLKYQWYRKGSLMASATSAVLQIASATTTDAGNYSVTVSNSAGKVTSATAKLSVLTPPSITTQPASRTVKAGSRTTFSVRAAGSSPLSYQWYRNGVAISGATSASYSISSVKTNHVGTYKVLVRNPVGSVTSADATLKLSGVIAAADDGQIGEADGASIRLLQDSVVIRSVGTPGNLYDLEACDDLSGNEWAVIGTVVAADDGLLEIEVPIETPIDGRRRFFRTVWRNEE